MDRIVDRIDVMIYNQDRSKLVNAHQDIEGLSHEGGLFMVSIGDDQDSEVSKYFYNSQNYIIEATYICKEVREGMLREVDPDPFIH